MALRFSRRSVTTREEFRKTHVLSATLVVNLERSVSLGALVIVGEEVVA